MKILVFQESSINEFVFLLRNVSKNDRVLEEWLNFKFLGSYVEICQIESRFQGLEFGE